MLDVLSIRQRELLNFLLKNKSGATVDGLSQRLQITRNAVRQHLAALENDGLVHKALTRPSGGRPEQLYVLTDKGHEFFPRQYSWFAQLLLESIEQEPGTVVVGDRLIAMGSKVGKQLRSQYPDLKAREEKVKKLSEVMEKIGYSTKMPTAESSDTVIEADNCVFHNLAIKDPDICKFDLALLSTFTESNVDHQECMAKGGNVCRFKFSAKTK
jgi:predicted ArsR family transcriptional regulator